MATSSSIIAGRALVLIEAVDKTGKVFPKIMARFKNFTNHVNLLHIMGDKLITAHIKALQFAIQPIKTMQIAWGALGQFVGFVLNTIASKLVNVGRQAVQLGFKLTLAAWAMVMPLYASVKEAAKLDTELLKAKAAAELTDDEMQNLSGTVKKVSRDTTFLSTEIAQVAKELARAGLKGPQLEAALLPVLNLARATDYDPAKAAEQFVQAVTVFGVGVEGYQKVSDNFVTAANESIVDMDDIGAAFSYVAGSAEATRFGLTRTLAALAQLSFSGLTGSKGGTSLNQFLESIGDKADDIKEAFGVETFLPTGELRNPLEILMDLSKVLNAMPDDQKLPHLTRIFNVRGARAVKALKSLENLNHMIEKMNSQIGVSTQQAATLDRGFEGSFRRIGRSVSNFRIEVGEAFRQPLAKLAHDLEIVFDKLGEWVKKNQQVVVSVGIMIIQLSAAGASMIALGITAQVTAVAMNGLALSVRAVTTAMEVMGAIAGLTAGASAGAIAAIIGGVLALFTAIYGVVFLVKKELSAAFIEAYRTWKFSFDKIIGGLKEVWKQIKNIASAFLPVFKSLVTDLISFGLVTFKILNKVAEIIWSTIIAGIKLWYGLLNVIAQITMTLLSPLFAIAKITRTLLIYALYAVLGVLQAISFILDTIVWTFETAFNAAITVAQGALTYLGYALWQFIKPLVQAYNRWRMVHLVIYAIGTTLFSAWKTMMQFFIATSPVVVLFKILWAVIEGIYLRITALYTALQAFVNLAFPFGKAFKIIGEIFAEVYDIAVSLFTLLSGTTAFNKMLMGLYKIGQAMHDFILQPLRDLLEYLKQISMAFRFFSGRQTELPGEQKSLSERKAQLGLDMARTVTASSITSERDTTADLEMTFKDSQQAETVSLLKQIEDRLRQIETQQRARTLGFGGI